MAEVLKTFDWGDPPRTRTTYNWEEIFDGKIRRFVSGKDFTVLPASFKANLLKKAKELKINLRAVLDNDDVVAGVVSDDA